MGLMKSASGCGCEALFTSGEEWAKFGPARHIATSDWVARSIASIVPISFPATKKNGLKIVTPLSSGAYDYAGAATRLENKEIAYDNLPLRSQKCTTDLAKVGVCEDSNYRRCRVHRLQSHPPPQRQPRSRRR